MLNIMLKVQFRGGKQTLVVTARTDALRAYMYKNGIWVAGKGEPFKIANLTPEFDVLWVSNEYQITKSLEREVRYMLETYLKNLDAVSNDEKVKPVWSWFDGEEYFFSYTKPEDYMAIQAGFDPTYSVDTPVFLVKFTCAITLQRRFEKYNTVPEYRHPKNFRDCLWNIPDAELKAEVEYILDSKSRMAEEAKKQRLAAEELLKAHTTDFDVSDDRVYGTPSHWGDVSFTDGTTRFVKVRCHRNDGRHTVMVEVPNANVPNEEIGTIQPQDRNSWDFSPRGTHYPNLTELSRLVGKNINLLTVFHGKFVDGPRAMVMVERVSPNLIALVSDSPTTARLLWGTLEKHEGSWLYFQMFGPELSHESIQYAAGDNAAISAKAFNSSMRHFESLGLQSHQFTLPSHQMGEPCHLIVNKVAHEDAVITIKHARGSDVVGVITHAGKQYPGARNAYIYHSRSNMSLNMEELSYALGATIVENGIVTPRPIGYCNSHGYVAAASYSRPTAQQLNANLVGGSRYSEIVFNDYRVTGRVRFLGSKKADLIHCMFADTNNLLIEENGTWRKFTSQGQDVEIFKCLVSNVGEVSELFIRDSWIPDAVIDVKHHSNQTHTTITKTRDGRTVSTTIVAPFGTYTDVATYAKNL